MTCLCYEWPRFWREVVELVRNICSVVRNRATRAIYSRKLCIRWRGGGGLGATGGYITLVIYERAVNKGRKI